MKNTIIFAALIAFVLAVYTGFVVWANTAEEAPYTVIETLDHKVELREYPAMVLAQVTVDKSFKDAGNEAFRMLFRYIDGANKEAAKVEMTAPVVQSADKASTKLAETKIEMTSPVLQQTDKTETPDLKTSDVDDAWVISFVLPTRYTAETAPVPTNERIKIVNVPARRVAAMQFSGTWAESTFDEKEKQLSDILNTQGFEFYPEAIIARYNPPFTPPFLRRNEVMYTLLDHIEPPATENPADLTE